MDSKPTEAGFLMDQEKKEKIALFRFGILSRLLWVKEEERQQEVSAEHVRMASTEII